MSAIWILHRIYYIDTHVSLIISSKNDISLLERRKYCSSLLISPTRWQIPWSLVHPNDLKAALSKFVKALGLSPAPNIILGGDLNNYPHVNWPEGVPSKGTSQDEKLMLNHINEMCNKLFLTHIIRAPTHKYGNILDLVFANNTAVVHETVVIPVFKKYTTSQYNTYFNNVQGIPSTKRQNPVCWNLWTSSTRMQTGRS